MESEAAQAGVLSAPLNLPRRTKKRLSVRLRPPLVVTPQPNAVWAVEFMSDTPYGGLRFRTLKVLDEGVREGLAIEMIRRFRKCASSVYWNKLSAGGASGKRFDSTMGQKVSQSGLWWCAERGIQLWHIQPGKPDQNALIERYSRTYRTKVLNAYVFEALDQVREISADWLQGYNEERPHEALAGPPPAT